MDFGALHWIRPLWLWALLLLPVWAGLTLLRARQASVWHSVVDAHLLPHLLATGAPPARRGGRWLAAIAYTLAVVALAGPSWRQVEQPLWRSHAPLVVALDLSSAIDHRDLPPSRLAQARSKLGSLLRQRQGGQVGLVAFAGDAFTVAPLTDDVANVALFLDALSSDVMPVDGQRIDRSIAWSVKLLQQAGLTEGDVLVMGDHATTADIAAAAAAGTAGVRVSVMGLGAGVRRDAAGGLDEASLRRLADAGRGTYHRITLDDADLRALDVLSARGTEGVGSTPGSGRTWRDEGYWLVPLVMLLVLPFFRRGAVVALLAVGIGWPLGTVQAADWWRRPDQVQHATLEAAIQRYREGDFQGAAQGFAQADSADAHYNRGNALAKAGRYAEAIQAYDESLRRAPGMADAQANRRAVQAAMKRRPPPGEGQGGQSTREGAKGSPSSAPPSSSAGQGGAGQSGSGQAPASRGESNAGGAESNDTDHRGGRPGAGTKGGAGASARPAGPPSRAGQAATSGAPSEPGDAAAQAKADAAQRARMRQALAAGQGKAGSAQDRAARAPARAETAAERERRIANEAWLRRVPDDPGGLLREKFRVEHQRRQQQGPPTP